MIGPLYTPFFGSESQWGPFPPFAKLCVRPWQLSTFMTMHSPRTGSHRQLRMDNQQREVCSNFWVTDKRCTQAKCPQQLSRRLPSIACVMDRGNDPPFSDLPQMKDRMGSVENSLEETKKLMVEVLSKLDTMPRRSNSGKGTPQPNQEVEGLRRELETLRRQRSEPFKLKILEPKAFNGDHCAKDLDNFLWDIEHYFGATRVQDRDKVTIATMFLLGDAKLWWRSQVELDKVIARTSIQEWPTLK